MERTLDSIKDVQIRQPKKGYRFSVDALLLEDFIAAKHLNYGIELGAGSGIISILLAKRLKKARIVSVELQKSLAGCARENVILNRLDDRIEIVNDDIKHLKKIYAANKFDFAFSNPPFRKTATGLLSIDEERAVARHEIKITLSDLIAAASYLLKNTGKFYLIYHPFRLIELTGLLKISGLEPKRMKFVHSKTG
ncbi:MAG: methyltransferase, partial [Nitrospirae bacterium]|nr:methyltransferase [Nitrospirota bacterium]